MYSQVQSHAVSSHRHSAWYNGGLSSSNRNIVKSHAFRVIKTTSIMFCPVHQYSAPKSRGQCDAAVIAVLDPFHTPYTRHRQQDHRQKKVDKGQSTCQGHAPDCRQQTALGPSPEASPAQMQDLEKSSWDTCKTVEHGETSACFACWVVIRDKNLPRMKQPKDA